MKRIEPPDSHHLSAAQGWHELGNPDEALREIQQVSEAKREHPDVLDVLWAIHAGGRRWEECVRIARLLTRQAPRSPRGWIHWAFALHEMKRTREAREVVAPQLDRFPREFLLRYNLACYEAQLGDLEAAWSCFCAALKLGQADQIREMALQDADLAPLRNRIRENKTNA